MTLKCEFCQKPISDDEVYEYGGAKVCEDCYIEKMSKPKTCDPGAVMAAKTSRKMQNQQGTEGLSAIQLKIYNLLKENGKMTHGEILKATGLSKDELETQFAVLRHCELAKGCKEGNTIYLTLMDS